jgi:hypothetical protein
MRILGPPEFLAERPSDEAPANPTQGDRKRSDDLRTPSVRASLLLVLERVSHGFDIQPLAMLPISVFGLDTLRRVHGRQMAIGRTSERRQRDRDAAQYERVQVREYVSRHRVS